MRTDRAGSVSDRVSSTMEPRHTPGRETSNDEPVDFKRGRFGRTTILFAAFMGVALVAIVALAVGVGSHPKPSQQILRGRMKPTEEEAPRRDNREGCPCGCDRSEAMASALELEPSDVALEAIDAALDTIAEREAAGYVTEAMISHRLRLVDLTSGISHGSGATYSPRIPDAPRAFELRADRRRLPVVEDETMRARTELIVHGEHTEMVEEREKLLRACFLVWMEIENLEGENLALTPPTIEARVPFPVSRWYLEGGDGVHWDGKLKAREKKSVHVIGYLSEAVTPGAVVHATVRLESLAIPITAHARRRWNQH